MFNDQSTIPPVLLVTQQPELAALWQTLLAPYTITVVAVPDPTAALEQFMAWLPEVILLDAALPEDGAVRCCLLLRQHPEGRDVPLLVLARRAAAAIADAVIQAGADDCMVMQQTADEAQALHRVLLLRRMRHAEREIAQIRQLHQQMFAESDAIQWLLDATSGAIVDANSAAQRFYGYALAQLRSMTLNDLSTDSPHSVHKLLEDALLGRRRHFLVRHRRASGSVHDIEMTVNLVMYQGQQFLHCINMEVTERLQIDSALRSLMTSLVRRAGQIKVAAEIARDVNAMENLQDLLARAVDLVRERFGFPYAGLFLVDDDREYVTLVAATGEAGQAMLAAGHRLRLDTTGIVPHTVNTRQPYQALDVRADSLHRPNPHMPETRSELALPLLVRGEPIGVLDVQSSVVNAFHEDDIQAFQIMADQLAVAIERTRLNTELQLHARRLEIRSGELQETVQALVDQIVERKALEAAERDQRDQAEALRDAAAELNSTLELQLVGERIIALVERFVPYDGANIMLLHDNRTATMLAMSAGSRRRGVIHELQIETLPDIQHVLKTGEPIVIADTHSYAGWSKLPEAHWIRASMTVPLSIAGTLLGFLKVDSTQPNVYTREQAVRLQAFAAQAAVAIHNALLYAEMEQRVRQRTAELEIERARLDSILNAMGEGVIFFDTQFRVQYTNRMLVTLLGARAAAWREESPFSLLLAPEGDDLTPLLRQMAEVCSHSGIWQGETRLLHTEGHILEVGLTTTSVPDTDGSPMGFVMVVRDIGEEKTLQARKTNFVSRASHELRTPITNLKTRLYLLRRQPERWEQHMAVLDKVANNMEALVDDLLDITRLEKSQTPLNAERLALQPVLLDVLHLQQQQAEEKRQQLTWSMIETPLHIHGDAAAITRLLTNLVMNAIHYTPEAGSIHVRLDTDAAAPTGTLPINGTLGNHHHEPQINGHGSAEQTSYAVIAVQDTGIGISPEHQQHIFEPFFRVSEATKGTGLGLSISREIVHLHGGSISVASEPGRGTTFTVWLPMVDVAAPLIPASEAPQQTSQDR